MSTKDETYKSWKRFSDFKLLAEYAKISDLRDTVTAWTHIQQVNTRWRWSGSEWPGGGLASWQPHDNESVERSRYTV